MEHYQEAYLTLFRRVTAAIEFARAENADETATILIQAQRDCEELFLAPEGKIVTFPP